MGFFFNVNKVTEERNKMVKKVAFIGAGSMAEAIMAGIINTKFLSSEQIFVTNKENEDRLKELKSQYNIVATQEKVEMMKEADIYIFAMKQYYLDSDIVDVNACDTI